MACGDGRPSAKRVGLPEAIPASGAVEGAEGGDDLGAVVAPAHAGLLL